MIWPGDDDPNMHDECIAMVKQQRARIAELEAEVARLTPSLLEEERRERQANAERRANMLSDECGALKSTNDQLIIQNAHLRRRLGE
jgi:hypothetical protein